MTYIETNDTQNEHSKQIDLVSVKLVREKSISYLQNVISKPHQIAKIFSDLINDSDKEQFVICCLNTKNQPTNISVISIGCLDCTLVHPREVFKVAILSNASAIILGHNHPSGNVEPSVDDKNMTKRICEVGKIHGIKVIDHIIVGYDNNYLSFRESGYIL